MIACQKNGTSLVSKDVISSEHAAVFFIGQNPVCKY